MFDYGDLWALLEAENLGGWAAHLKAATHGALQPERNGHWPRWQPTLEALPDKAASTRAFTSGVVKIGAAEELDDEERARLKDCLRAFHPWRKGPFDFFNIYIDTEWRSDWKWARVGPHLRCLQGSLVLDIGSGNGYYGWRMLGQGARAVLGLDPFLAYTIQYQAARHFLPGLPNWVLPVGVEALHGGLGAFDAVLSMGVIYHRRDPVAHVKSLFGALKAGGEAVVESIVIDGPAGAVLEPDGRYAKMRNVYQLPSVVMLEQWMRAGGFTDVRTVDVSVTTVEEQRTTEWMRFDSLATFLDPADPTRTVEDHPAPVRAVVIGMKS